jgi:L-alanine-DL-glutamate epimerase-like enolase superfamily enzyme
MIITDIEVFILRAPDTGRPHWVSHFIVPRANEILVRLKTDEGIEGFGIATSYTPIEAAIHCFRSGPVTRRLRQRFIAFAAALPSK